MLNTLQNIWLFLKKSPRLQGALIFAAVLAFFYFTWSASITQERNLNGRPLVLLWGYFDITGFFINLVNFEARLTKFLLTNLLGHDAVRYGFVLCHPREGFCMQVIWDCSGLKQLLEFAVPVLLYPYCHKQKLWYLPLGLVLLFGFNILRLVAIYLSGYDGPAAMDSMHDIFKFLFNGVVFLLWLVWNEFIYSRKYPHKAK